MSIYAHSEVTDVCQQKYQTNQLSATVAVSSKSTYRIMSGCQDSNVAYYNIFPGFATRRKTGG